MTNLNVTSRQLPENRIGVVYWWSSRDILIAADELKDAFAFNAPDFEHLVPSSPTDFHACLRRAIARSRSSLTDSLDWATIGTDGSHLIMALVEIDRSKAERKFDSHSKWTVQVCDKTGILETLDEKRNHLDISQLPKNELVALQSLMSKFSEERNYLTYPDLLRMLQLLNREMQTVRIKKGGSVYFVPKTHDHIIEKCKEAFRVAGVSLVRIPIVDGDIEARDIAEPARESILEDAMQLSQTIKEWTDKAGSGARIKKSAGVSRLEEIAALQEKAATYETLLQIGLEDVKLALAQSKQLLLATVDELAKKK